MDNFILWLKKKKVYSEKKIIMALLKIKSYLDNMMSCSKMRLDVETEVGTMDLFYFIFLNLEMFKLSLDCEQLLRFCLKSIKCSNI